MTTRILCLYYSQTGQLERVARSFCEPLMNNDSIDVDMFPLEPEKPFQFPWPFMTFFNTFPETVHEDAIGLKPLPLSDEQLAGYDLVIFAYQVWFLTPSLPTSSFLQTEQAKVLFKDTPVITLIACRNMWLMAQEIMKDRLQGLGARLIDNVVLIDSANTAMSFVATPLWMLTGKKGPVGPVPKAGVSEQDIEGAQRFGTAIKKAVESGTNFDTPLFRGLSAVKINANLILSEKMARRGFVLWGLLIRFIGRTVPVLRKPIVALYIVYLVTLILTFVPITAIIKKLLSPLMKDKIAEQVAYFAAPSGDEDYQLKESG